MTVPEQIKWLRVNGEPFEYAIQQGPHGDEFVKLLDGSCLRRALTAARLLVGVQQTDRRNLPEADASMLICVVDAAIEAIERGSTSAPILECLKAGRSQFLHARSEISALPQSGSVQCREDVARAPDTDLDFVTAGHPGVRRAPKPAGQPVEGWREALQPFAEAARFFEQRYLDGDSFAYYERKGGEEVRITIGDLRRAARALSPAPASPHEVHEREIPVVKPIGQERS